VSEQGAKPSNSSITVGTETVFSKTKIRTVLLCTILTIGFAALDIMAVQEESFLFLSIASVLIGVLIFLLLHFLWLHNVAKSDAARQRVLSSLLSSEIDIISLVHSGEMARVIFKRKAAA